MTHEIVRKRDKENAESGKMYSTKKMGKTEWEWAFALDNMFLSRRHFITARLPLFPQLQRVYNVFQTIFEFPLGIRRSRTFHRHLFLLPRRWRRKNWWLKFFNVLPLCMRYVKGHFVVVVVVVLVAVVVQPTEKERRHDHKNVVGRKRREKGQNRRRVLFFTNISSFCKWLLLKVKTSGKGLMSFQPSTLLNPLYPSLTHISFMLVCKHVVEGSSRAHTQTCFDCWLLAIGYQNHYRENGHIAMLSFYFGGGAVCALALDFWSPLFFPFFLYHHHSLTLLQNSLLLLLLLLLVHVQTWRAFHSAK